MDKINQSSLYKKILDTKLLRILISVDKQVTKNLMYGHIATRPSGTNGLWCCLLLPTVLLLYSNLHEVSELYTLLAYISIGLLCYCLLFIVFLSISCLVLKENIYGGCEAASLAATLLLYACQGQGLFFSLIYSSIAVYSFSILLRLTLTKCSQTFSIGEAMVVVQSIVLFGVMAVSKILYNMGDKSDEEMKFINSVIFGFLFASVLAIFFILSPWVFINSMLEGFNSALSPSGGPLCVETILSSVGIIVTALSVLDDSKKNLKTLLYIVSAAGTYALIVLHVQLGVDCIIIIASYILLDVKKVKLFLFWLVLVAISAFVVLIRTQLNIKASTVTRKTFHILASMVFLSGILYDIKLMILAAGIGFGLMILVEALRKAEIPKISPALQAAFEVYSDEKDVGCFAMTPMYLYVGLACPLLLVPVHPGYELELLSGVLSIGVGDSAASWFGSKYGFNKWADGHKSVEGTAFNILSQVAVIYSLDLFGLLTVPNALLRVAITATISGLVEAKTDQVDNLILPLVTLIAFQVTSVLCY